MFEKFKETLKLCAESIKDSLTTLTPTKLRHGCKSDTVILFFDDYSHNILENILENIHQKVKYIFNEAQIGNIEI